LIGILRRVKRIRRGGRRRRRIRRRKKGDG